ncbi:hypothetical protein [uncultured Enterovirga sp.]|uniref:MmyB family transcriptional regulator n=1 Tax=uncultured Enterovirga sp. TaxID=2026352 RepID=UPI0035CC3673
MVDERSRLSGDFAALWQNNYIASYSEGIKRIDHPEAGRVELEYSAFAVDGRPDLGMLVFNPVTDEAAARIESLVEARSRTSAA